MAQLCICVFGHVSDCYCISACDTDILLLVSKFKYHVQLVSSTAVVINIFAWLMVAVTLLIIFFCFTLSSFFLARRHQHSHNFNTYSGWKYMVLLHLLECAPSFESEKSGFYPLQLHK